jgi:hypothetical protein
MIHTIMMAIFNHWATIAQMFRECGLARTQQNKFEP